MADTIKTNTFPIVTSLSDTDYLLADGANGPKRITQSNVTRNLVNFYLAANAPTDGVWIRLFSGGAMTMGMLYVTNRWSYTTSKPMCFMFLGASPRSMATVQLIPIAYCVHFMKARIVYDNTSNGSSTYHVEVLTKILKSTDELTVFAQGINFSLVTGYTPGEIPEGWQVKEFDLSAVVLRGGVIYYIPADYKIDSEKRKGGWHER
ncbi:MAG: hypothetical protein K2J24_02980, partial [Muribaculaceae bacterium]|nr:hypothetical protein [Muribaculaceae bacterium]